LNDARPVGEAGRLDVRIKRKAFTAAAGDRLELLHDMSFALAEREVGVLFGPSGCGKTTMLRIIAGLDRDFEGTITRPPGRVSMVFQEPRLLPWRSVEENVRLVAPNLPDATLASLFAVLELEGYLRHYPGELSLGLARRVALARAFAIEPALLLLDEPYVSLDAALARRLREELAALMETRSMTALLVTHDLEEAVRLGDRIIVLSTRPTRILAELPLKVPRRARTEAQIAAMMAEVAGRIAPR
jgi:ABC-type nitrate/sulfonate/bicarbonate transport system ATPase subunit